MDGEDGRFLTRRCIVPELMDDPAADREDLARSLQFIRMVNRRLGGAAAALHHLRRWSRFWPPGETVRILDVGTGSADIPLAIVRWAAKEGFRVHITAVDLHETTLELARVAIEGRCEIELVQANALHLMDQFKPGSFDYAHAGMFLHHLQDIEVVTVLRIMDRLATGSVIWNDLIRGVMARIGVRLAILAYPGLPAMARHDARVSVQAGFTKAEAIDLAERAGLSPVAYRRHRFHRFTLVNHKQRPGS